MARLSRIVLPGIPHHVTQRGIKAKRLDGKRVIVAGTFRADLVGPNITFSRCNASGIQVVKINDYGG